MIIKNKLAHIVFSTVYIVLGLIAFIGSLGYFKQSFNSEFYVFYTNLSNYLCIGFMLLSLIFSLKNFASKNGDKYCPKVKFIFMIMILVTLLVYNILLANEHTISSYFLSINNLLMHLILPIMFLLDWILFYKHNNSKWYYPLLCTILPLIYVIFILIRASILKGSVNVTLYPYFFLNLEKLGLGGFLGWLSALVAVFILIGYIFYFLDNYIKFFKKNKNNIER